MILAEVPAEVALGNDRPFLTEGADHLGDLIQSTSNHKPLRIGINGQPLPPQKTDDAKTRPLSNGYGQARRRPPGDDYGDAGYRALQGHVRGDPAGAGGKRPAQVESLPFDDQAAYGLIQGIVPSYVLDDRYRPGLIEEPN